MKGREIKFKHAAIALTEISQAHAWAHNNRFSCVRIVLKDGRHVEITNCMREPEKIAKTFG